MKTAFNVVFTMALILGLVSTVAANAPLGTAPQVLTSNQSEAWEDGPTGRPTTSPRREKTGGAFRCGEIMPATWT